MIDRGDLDAGRVDLTEIDSGERTPEITPGDILRSEFMEPLGLSAKALGRALGVPTNRVTAILDGSCAITATTALRLGRRFGTSAAFWMHLQVAHDMRAARARMTA